MGDTLVRMAKRVRKLDVPLRIDMTFEEAVKKLLKAKPLPKKKAIKKK